MAAITSSPQARAPPEHAQRQKSEADLPIRKAAFLQDLKWLQGRLALLESVLCAICSAPVAPSAGKLEVRFGQEPNQDKHQDVLSGHKSTMQLLRAV